MADDAPGGGLSNLFSAAQNIARAIGQLNQTLGNSWSNLLSTANSWAALQTFSAGISTNSVATTSNLVLGGGVALATNATTGFVEIPTMSGTPTGVPVGAGTGKTAMVYDTSAHKIWFYDQPAGAWKGVAVT